MHLDGRLIFLFVAACFLTACLTDEEHDKLMRKALNEQSELLVNLKKQVTALSKKETELYELQEKFEAQKFIEEARIKAADESAAVFEACRLVINVCPESILAPGRKAIENGSNGGRSDHFWYLFMLKTLTFAALFAGVLGLILEGLLGRYKPVFSAGKDAREWLEQAEVEKTQATKEIQRLEKLRLSKMNEVNAVNEKISAVNVELKDAQAAYELETAILQHELNKLAEEQKRQAGIARAASVFKDL